MEAVKCIPVLPAARYALTSSMPISIAALLATPSVAQFPVSENNPPMVISLFEGAVESLSHPPMTSPATRSAENFVMCRCLRFTVRFLHLGLVLQSTHDKTRGCRQRCGPIPGCRLEMP